MTDIVLFIFRRDLRVIDNLGLNKAIEYCKTNNCKLMLCFTFTSKQVKDNKYFSEKGFQFMVNSLDELNKSVKGNLSFFEGEDFYKLIPVKAIFFNKDYTPYAVRRDRAIVQYCSENDIECITCEDYTLHGIEKVKTLNDKPYQMLTPFYKKALTFTVSKPLTMNMDDVKMIKKGTIDLDKYDKGVDVGGGRERVLDKLEMIKNGTFDDYKKNRDYVGMENSTTMMSAYLKFGCCSIRELYHLIKNTHNKDHELIRQLYAKEFYANVAYHFPKVLGKMIGKKNDNMNDTNVKWKYDKKQFDKWMNGETGFPLVDAGMRQMNKTGFMHNRLRMITASFLIKDLHIDWRKGEQYFAKQLIDYDPASNNGGWQWVAGTGTDSTPYFRIFNPWTQIKRFDKECKYIKQWIPELNDVKNNDIMNWYKTYNKYPNIDYYKPIVDHDEEKAITLDLYN